MGGDLGDGAVEGGVLLAACILCKWSDLTMPENSS